MIGIAATACVDIGPHMGSIHVAVRDPTKWRDEGAPARISDINAKAVRVLRRGRYAERTHAPRVTDGKWRDVVVPPYNGCNASWDATFESDVKVTRRE